jgi:hypothetical protein
MVRIWLSRIRRGATGKDAELNLASVRMMRAEAEVDHGKAVRELSWQILAGWKNPAGSKSEPASAGGSNRLGGSRGQFPVPHPVEHPFHHGDNLRGGPGESGHIGFGDQITIDASPSQHGSRIGQLIGQPGQRVR